MAKGTVVAVEGNAELVSLQLRLLPQSSNILIVPDTIRPVHFSTDSFDARLMILDTHRALTERARLTESFLESFHSNESKLIFFNGGSLGARTDVIRQLAKHLTNGDVKAAERHLEEICREGIAGLEQHERNILLAATPKQHGDMPGGGDIEAVQSEHPSLTAMRRAEELDRNTSHLDLLEEDSGVAESFVTASTAEDEDEVETPRFPRDTQHNLTIVLENDDHLNSSAETLLEIERKRATFGSPSPMPGAFTENHDGSFPEGSEGGTSTHLAASDRQISGLSGPSTPGNFELGEAFVVDAPPSKRPSYLKRIKSVDRFIPSRTRHRHAIGPSLKPSYSMQSLIGGDEHVCRDTLLGPIGFESAPRASFVRASQTFIRRLPSSKRVCSAPAGYYLDQAMDALGLTFEDKGTSTDDYIEDETEVQLRAFEPVLPISEDLIIRLNDDCHSETLDFLISIYLSQSSSQLSGVQDSHGIHETKAKLSNAFSSIEDGELYEDGDFRPESSQTQLTTDTAQTHRHYRKYSGDSIRETSTIELLTPATTPPPPMTVEFAQKFRDILVHGDESVVKIQNSLRATLDSQFPSQTPCFPGLSSSSEKLFQPLGLDCSARGKRIVDQIIAVGCEETVDKNLFTEITTSIERLGFHKEGPVKSGRIDLRYLIQNAILATLMASRHYENSISFCEPESLAVLLILQLELYLSSHPSLGLLVLHFSPEFLPIILSLRQLLSSDIFKIVAIIDPTTSDPPLSLTHTPSVKKFVNPLSNEGAANLNSRHRQRGRQENSPLLNDSSSDRKKESCSSLKLHDEKVESAFTKANFILPCTATAMERNTFLSTIRGTLVAVSSFYIAEIQLSDSISPFKTRTPQLQTTSSMSSTEEPPIKRPVQQHILSNQAQVFDSMSQQRKASSESYGPSQGLTSHPPPSTPAGPGPRQGKLDQILGHGYGQNQPMHQNSSPGEKMSPDSRDRKQKLQKAWDNFYFESGLDTDEDLDDFDRRLMPRFEKREVKKGNSRKALKWLGLA